MYELHLRFGDLVVEAEAVPPVQVENDQQPYCNGIISFFLVTECICHPDEPYYLEGIMLLTVVHLFNDFIVRYI